MWVGPVVHKKKVIILYAQMDHSLFEGARYESGGSRRCGYFPRIENVNVVVLAQLNISIIRSLKFTEDHKLQLHLSRNELFGAGPVVHNGVQCVSCAKKT